MFEYTIPKPFYAYECLGFNCNANSYRFFDSSNLSQFLKAVANAIKASELLFNHY